MIAKHAIRILIVTALAVPAALVLKPSDAAVRWSVHPELGAAFTERWSWGRQQAGGEGWVGYAVARWAEPDQHFLSGSVIVFGDGGMRVRRLTTGRVKVAADGRRAASRARRSPPRRRCGRANGCSRAAPRTTGWR